MKGRLKWATLVVLLIGLILIGVTLYPRPVQKIVGEILPTQPCKEPFPFQFEVQRETVWLKNIDATGVIYGGGERVSIEDIRTPEGVALGIGKTLDVFTSPYSGDIYRVLDISNGIATIKFNESHDIGTSGHCRYILKN